MRSVSVSYSISPGGVGAGGPEYSAGAGGPE